MLAMVMEILSETDTIKYKLNNWTIFYLYIKKWQKREFNKISIFYE